MTFVFGCDIINRVRMGFPFSYMWIRRNAPPRVPPRVKIEAYADVVELVDSLDLGAVTSVKVFPISLTSRE